MKYILKNKIKHKNIINIRVDMHQLKMQQAAAPHDFFMAAAVYGQVDGCMKS